MALNFRPLAKTDFPLFAYWLAQEHVQRWWPEPATVEHVEKEYGACTNGDLRVAVYVVQDDSTPIGIIQVYELDEDPEYAAIMQMPGAVSIDYFIGESSYIGRGYGTKMIADFIGQVIKPNYPDATGIATAPEIANLASIRILEKNGFIRDGIVPGDYGPEQRMKLRF